MSDAARAPLPNEEAGVNERSLNNSNRENRHIIEAFIVVGAGLMFFMLLMLRSNDHGATEVIRLRPNPVSTGQVPQSATEPFLEVLEVAMKDNLVACGVPRSRMNDDFCDCPMDGSDETRTSACSPVGFFHCDGDRRLAVSRLMDGVLDCCDKSDEPGSAGLLLPPYCKT